MKKFITCAIILFIMLVVTPADMTVRAQGSASCVDTGIVSYETDPVFGFDIVTAQKTFPENPVVVTQEETHYGVDLEVEIVSYKGTVTYETYSEECAGFDEPQRGMEKCKKFYYNNLYHYVQGKCTPHTETVYRYIDGASLQVWLKPTPKTEAWLGWGAEGEGTPLRKVFPEKWSLGTWTPEGFTTEGNPGLWTEAQIAAFVAAHPGYNFLYGDPRTTDLPVQFLTLASDPLQPNESSRVIPLYGTFYAWGPYGMGGTMCKVEGTGPDGQGDCAVNVNGLTGLFSEGDIFADGIHSLDIQFAHIPMDLPGEWQIGVSVSVHSATYGGGKPEKESGLDYVNPDHLYRNPNHDYPMEEHSFLTYIWMTTPCNPGEVEGCGN
jgi:hypothetical protein